MYVRVWIIRPPTVGFPYALWKGLVYLGTPRFEGPKPPIYRLVSQVTIRIDPFLKSLWGIRGSQWNSSGSWKLQTFLLQGSFKWWYPTTIGFPTKNDHFGVFWGYHHLRKHPFWKNQTLQMYGEFAGAFPWKYCWWKKRNPTYKHGFGMVLFYPVGFMGVPGWTTVPSGGTLDFWTINSRALFGFVSCNDPWLEGELPR